MASCNSWQYLVTILAKIFPRSWQDLAKILLRYPWRVDPGRLSQCLFGPDNEKLTENVKREERGLRDYCKFSLERFFNIT